MKKLLLPATILAALTPGLAYAHPGHEHGSDVLSHSLVIVLIALGCVGATVCVSLLRARGRAARDRALPR